MEKKKRLKWYCYICGGKLGQIFFLASPTDRTDRVFLVCDEKEGHGCFHRLDKENISFQVHASDMRY